MTGRKSRNSHIAPRRLTLSARVVNCAREVDAAKPDTREGLEPRACLMYMADFRAPLRKAANRTRYFNEVLIDVNLSFRLVPRPLTTAMIASAMPAAIKPYSIAVAPDSSDRKFKRVRFNSASVGFGMDRGP